MRVQNLKLRDLGLGNKGFYSPETKILPTRYQRNSWYICGRKSTILNQDIIVFPISSVSSRSNFLVQNFLEYLIARFPRYNRITEEGSCTHSPCGSDHNWGRLFSLFGSPCTCKFIYRLSTPIVSTIFGFEYFF